MLSLQLSGKFRKTMNISLTYFPNEKQVHCANLLSVEDTEYRQGIFHTVSQ
jgi:hypothetical protein